LFAEITKCVTSVTQKEQGLLMDSFQESLIHHDFWKILLDEKMRGSERAPNLKAPQEAIHRAFFSLESVNFPFSVLKEEELAILSFHQLYYYI
jgi:hypothetical protein